ncbi:hypothetical protein CHLNCDRAFT_59198 [Chlorella variabilis]|uniref:Putative GTP diphosphokinase RSH1, chloroplastic n=1 Tax=Chlorella variabilis TaxID=554065 RepID=E1ZRJ9_CHLVA|nr:hypothetical protein CHLNCDRAFT_59198 [Chlorella variabilis]EFN51639.1 hypothetical protein CHLNCDRAFT_59198 [Chlorella variabilis]|eukprot:XP_005843741.1 hypothetical protein CHLNCDRAFT_59198 [Chlorella variabilis]
MGSLLLDRLLSHAAAGPSVACGADHGPQQRVRASPRGPGRTLAFSGAAWQRGSSLGTPPRQVASRGRARRRGSGGGGLAVTTTCQALQVADYSFYQRLREGELTEDYLWETRLLPLLGYLSAAEATAVREALSLAYDAHSGQRRKSGEPFITHPVEVTRILAELRMDYESLVAGLLHDTVEDCGDVVRIIVVKLADRLHNMRTMASMPPSKQRRIAQETLQVLFCPCIMHANWRSAQGSVGLGVTIRVVPTGLDLASALQNGAVLPAVRRKSGVQLLFPIEVQIRTEAMNRLAENGIAVESWSCADRSWRAASGEDGIGTLDSWFTATSESNGSGSSSGSSGDEWEAGGGAPLANGNGAGRGGAARGAGAAATAADSARRFPFNLGMLVASMAGGAKQPQQQAPRGANGSSNGAGGANGNGRAALNGAAAGGAAAALSSGEGVLGEGAIDPQVLSRRINWLKSIREWQSEFVGTLTASEFVECVTDDLLGQSVFVFTPSGEVVRLPKGATVIDFAYHIHTEMGNTMVAAKVNGKVVSADRELQNAGPTAAARTLRPACL